MNQAYVKHIQAVAIFSILWLLASCAVINQINPVGVAETTEQKAFALYGTYVVWAERAPGVVRNKNLPIRVRKRVQSTMKIAKPLVDNMYSVAKSLNRVRMDVKRGEVSTDNLVRLTDDLKFAIQSAEHGIKPFIRSMEAAK